MTARTEAEAPGAEIAPVLHSQRELAELCRQLAREGLLDHEIAADLDLEVNDVRRFIGRAPASA
jgi:hypothetical protein